MYGVMDDVFKFAATFKDYPPRSCPSKLQPSERSRRDPSRHQSREETERSIPNAEHGKVELNKWRMQAPGIRFGRPIVPPPPDENEMKLETDRRLNGNLVWLSGGLKILSLELKHLP